MKYSKKYKPCFVTLFVNKKIVGCCYVPECSMPSQRRLEAKKAGILFYDGIRFERGKHNKRIIFWNTDFPKHKHYFKNNKTQNILTRR